MSFYKLEMAVFMTVNTLSVIAESSRPWAMKMILDNANSRNMTSTYWYLGLLGVATIGGNLINSLTQFCGDRIIIPLSRQVKQTVFKKILDLDFAFHVDKNTGSLISAFRRSDNAIFSIFSYVFSN